ncbi:uncharacterized protein BJ212DRAFT_1488077 [Suillus subaureus]|uniref:Uncharacterized protein n=1 Tax=Suillus subaureus TaxID=48587 RepID=A0A9P7DPS5_9AGAM|nr:uncharacterized protein BJ212DRAFT_1488077 [Suillus subaureus]KAG1800074.1 hypothetical protein BJ212DRAFT_1488077 [Suillus subaureus]
MECGSGLWDMTDTQDVAAGKACLEAVFNVYYKPSSQTPASAKEPSPLPTRPSHKNQYGDDWMHKAIKTCQEMDYLTHNPQQELNMYLSLPLEETDDIVAWWGVGREGYYF